MTGKFPRRGEIWWVALDPTIGSEIQKTRPCAVLSIDIVNEHRRTVLVVPLSSSQKANPPVTVKVTCQEKSGIAVVDQIRSISKERLRGFIEEGDPEEIKEIT